MATFICAIRSSRDGCGFLPSSTIGSIGMPSPMPTNFLVRSKSSSSRQAASIVHSISPRITLANVARGLQSAANLSGCFSTSCTFSSLFMPRLIEGRMMHISTSYAFMSYSRRSELSYGSSTRSASARSVYLKSLDTSPLLGKSDFFRRKPPAAMRCE